MSADASVVQNDESGIWSLQSGAIELFDQENSFARIFALALGQNEYNEVVVGGYSGEFFPRNKYGSSITLDAPNDDAKFYKFYQYPLGADGWPDKNQVDQKTRFIKWFNSKGEEVEKPYETREG